MIIGCEDPRILFFVPLPCQFLFVCGFILPLDFLPAIPDPVYPGDPLEYLFDFSHAVFFAVVLYAAWEFSFLFVSRCSLCFFLLCRTFPRRHFKIILTVFLLLLAVWELFSTLSCVFCTTPPNSVLSQVDFARSSFLGLNGVPLFFFPHFLLLKSSCRVTFFSRFSDVLGWMSLWLFGTIFACSFLIFMSPS